MTYHRCITNQIKSFDRSNAIALPRYPQGLCNKQCLSQPSAVLISAASSASSLPSSRTSRNRRVRNAIEPIPRRLGDVLEGAGEWNKVIVYGGADGGAEASANPQLSFSLKIWGWSRRNIARLIGSLLYRDWALLTTIEGFLIGVWFHSDRLQPPRQNLERDICPS